MLHGIKYRNENRIFTFCEKVGFDILKETFFDNGVGGVFQATENLDQTDCFHCKKASDFEFEKAKRKLFA